MHHKRKCLFVVFSSLFFMQQSYAFWVKPKHWSIDDFITRKVYEIDNTQDQQKCVQVKHYLLQVRKEELESQDFDKHAIVISLVSSVLGAVLGALQGADAGEDSLRPLLYALVGLIVSAASGPAYKYHAEQELDYKIPESMKFYEECLHDKGLIARTPRQVLDRLEYVPKFSKEHMEQIKKQMIARWAAETIAR